MLRLVFFLPARRWPQKKGGAVADIYTCVKLWKIEGRGSVPWLNLAEIHVLILALIPTPVNSKCKGLRI